MGYDIQVFLRGGAPSQTSRRNSEFQSVPRGTWCWGTWWFGLVRDYLPICLLSNGAKKKKHNLRRPTFRWCPSISPRAQLSFDDSTCLKEESLTLLPLGSYKTRKSTNSKRGHSSCTWLLESRYPFVVFRGTLKRRTPPPTHTKKEKTTSKQKRTPKRKDPPKKNNNTETIKRRRAPSDFEP